MTARYSASLVYCLEWSQGETDKTKQVLSSFELVSNDITNVCVHIEICFISVINVSSDAGYIPTQEMDITRKFQ